MSATRSSASSITPAVSLRGVGKSYTVWADPSERILGPMRKFLGLGASETAARSFTAVREVSLDIMPGECLGIIGRNGAGKSTLLQMIAGTLRPSTGAIAVNGRVAALLELGSGFNPDFTGRENVHLYAAVMGLGREEIEARYEAIQAYAGIGPFIDQPVRTYSTGMAVRLAFAVCAHVDADILIIDEALAVGDARFQFKCHATLEQMQREGRTIIFVSHDTNAVKRMCRTAVLLEAGEVLLKGDPNEVVNLYTKLITSPHGLEGIRADLEAARQDLTVGAALRRDPTALSPDSPSPPRDPLPHQSPEAASLIAEERAHRQISDREYAYGGEAGRIAAVAMTDEGDRPRLSFISGSTIRIRLICEAAADVPEPIYALTLKDIRGQEVFGTNTYFQDLTPPSVPAGCRVEACFEVKLNLLPGVYFASVGWVRLVNGEVVVVHRRYDVLRFDVMPRDRSFGIADCPTAISVGPVSQPS